jgi:hypothetical protein
MEQTTTIKTTGLIIMGLFVISNLFSQQPINQLLDCNNVNNLYPSTDEIVKKFQKEGSRQMPNGATRLLETDIAGLRPVVFVKVFPDTVNQSLQFQLDTKSLELWRNDGCIFAWGSAILNYGSKWEMPYKNIIENLPVSTCLFFVYFQKNRYADHYLAYKNSAGNIVYVARNSTMYNSLEEIVNRNYGGFAVYAQKYCQQRDPRIDPTKFVN